MDVAEKEDRAPIRADTRQECDSEVYRVLKRGRADFGGPKEILMIVKHLNSLARESDWGN